MEKELHENAVREARDRYYPILSKLYEDKKDSALTRYAAFVIGGVARNGKDQWIDFMNEKDMFAAVESTIDPVKDIAKLIAAYEDTKLGNSVLGNNTVRLEMDAKTDNYREFLFQLKKAWLELDDGPNRITMSRVWERRLVAETMQRKNERVKCCFIHVREPDEIKKWLTRLEDSGFICASVCVRGRIPKDDYQNHAEQQTLDYDYDIYVENTGGLDQLRADAYGFRLAFLKAFGYITYPNPYQDLV